MQVKVTVEPVEEPVSIEEVKEYLKIDFDNEDQLISTLITAVREAAQHYTGLSFVTQTRLAYLTTGLNDIPYGPIQSVSSVVRVNYDSTETDLTTDEYYTEGLDYLEIFVGRRFRLSQDFSRMNKIKVTYVSGFGDASMVPSAIKVAILKEVAELYENRENTLVGSIVADLSTTTKKLLDPFKRNVLI